MELKGDLQFLIEKTWALHDGLAHEIKDINSFCSFSSENDRFCGVSVAHSSFQETQRLISVRDSLKQVEHHLLLLQRLRSRQLTDERAALNRLEESRINLIARLNEYKGRALDIVEDLNASFDNGNSVYEWQNKEKEEEKRVRDIVH